MLQRKNRLRALSLGAVAVSGALALTACGSDAKSGDNASSSASASASSSIKCDNAKGQLQASGSTAQKNAIDAWVKQYTQACSGVQLNYNGTGSGAGVTAFLGGQTAFAGSDSALKPEQITASKKVCSGGQAIDLPMVGGPIAIGFNVPGVTSLVLDPATIAQIFNSKITNWNDPAIKKLNPSAKLPNLKIQAFHRSDESGTTDNFTKYLIATAKSDWPYSGGKAWQAKGGQSASGSAGLAQQVKQTSGAISYFELSYASNGSINTVDLKTGASTPAKATVDNASKAIATAQVAGTGKDLALKLNYQPTEADAYPLTLVTYEIVCDKGNKADTLPAVKSFLTYTASEDGQNMLTAANYAPIPAEIIAKVRTTISGLS